MSMVPGCLDKTEAMQNAGRLLEEATESTVRIFRLTSLHSRGD